jgi:hypothetical protein
MYSKEVDVLLIHRVVSAQATIDGKAKGQGMDPKFFLKEQFALRILASSLRNETTYSSQ